MSKPKWKGFEGLVYAIQKELAQDAVVELDVDIDGVDSKTKHQLKIPIVA